MPPLVPLPGAAVERNGNSDWIETQAGWRRLRTFDGARGTWRLTALGKRHFAQNKPPSFLLKDQALTEVAKLRPHSPDDLLQQASRLIHPNFARFNGKVIVALLNRPVTEPELEEAEVNTAACARPFSMRCVFTPMFRCVSGAALRADPLPGPGARAARRRHKSRR